MHEHTANAPTRHSTSRRVVYKLVEVTLMKRRRNGLPPARDFSLSYLSSSGQMQIVRHGRAGPTP
jgi:hypothetical protein